MARNGVGSVWNRFLNIVGLVDADDEPTNDGSVQYDQDPYGYGGQRGYQPRARQNDRPQPSRRSGNGGYSNPSPRQDFSSGRGAIANPRGYATGRQQDVYSEWNTAPRRTNRYADTIYDDDTTIRGGLEGREDNAYGMAGGRSSRRDYGNERYSSDGGSRYDAGQYDNARYDNSRRRISSRYSGYADESSDFPREQDARPANRQAVKELPGRSRSGEVVVFDIRILEDCRDVIHALLANKTVVFTLEEMDKQLIRRVVDTLSGAACALDATIRRTSDVSYLIAPSSVEVNGTHRTVERRY